MANERAMKRHRRSWSAKEKREMVEQARRLREQGSGWAQVSRALDVRPASIQLWMRQAEPEILPVAVASAVVETKESVSLIVVTPDGYRIEGLDLESAQELLEYLRC